MWKEHEQASRIQRNKNKVDGCLWFTVSVSCNKVSVAYSPTRSYILAQRHIAQDNVILFLQFAHFSH